jgi:hypothetical protein
MTSATGLAFGVTPFTWSERGRRPAWAGSAASSFLVSLGELALAQSTQKNASSGASSSVR